MRSIQYRAVRDGHRPTCDKIPSFKWHIFLTGGGNKLRYNEGTIAIDMSMNPNRCQLAKIKIPCPGHTQITNHYICHICCCDPSYNSVYCSLQLPIAVMTEPSSLPAKPHGRRGFLQEQPIWERRIIHHQLLHHRHQSPYPGRPETNWVQRIGPVGGLQKAHKEVGRSGTNR